MKLSEMFHEQVATVEPTVSIGAAANLMKEKNVGAVVVTKDRKVVGIVTDRDMTLRCIAGGVNLAAPVSEIMSSPVITIWDDQGVFNATQYLRGHKVRRLPIIDRQDNLMGMMTADDLAALLAREALNVAQAYEPAIGTSV